MNTVGEANVVDLFTSIVENSVWRHFGDARQYLKGNLAGKADELFADYFLGVPFSNVLIEFKDTKNDQRREKRKSLRLDLCQNLTNQLHDFSLSCHFLGFGEEDASSLFISLSEYVSAICPILGGASVALKDKNNFDVYSFLSQIFNKEIGLPVLDFVTYLQFLASLPNINSGTATDLADIDFPALHLSYSDDGKILSRPIHSLADLKIVAELLQQYTPSTPAPPGGAGSAPPSNDDNSPSMGMF